MKTKQEKQEEKKSDLERVQTLTNSYLMIDNEKINGVIDRYYNWTDYNRFSKPQEDYDVGSGVVSSAGGGGSGTLPNPIVNITIQLPDGNTTNTALGWSATGEQDSGWIRSSANNYSYLVNGSPVTTWVAGEFRVNYDASTYASLLTDSLGDFYLKPTGALIVQENSSNTSELWIDAPHAKDSILYLSDTLSVKWSLYRNATNNDLRIDDDSDTRIRIYQTTGNIGFGSSSEPLFWDNAKQGLTITNTVATTASTGTPLTLAYPASVGGTDPTAFRIARSGSPYDYDIYVRGGYYSSTWMVLSGHATGLGGPSFRILEPTSDSNTLGIWCDVNSAAVQIRCNTASAPNRALDVVDASTGGVYLFSILPSGALSWGNGTFAAQDTTLAWNSANNLLLTGSMTASVQFVTNGSVSAPGFSFTGRLTDGVYDTGSAVGIAVGGVNQLLIATNAMSCPGTITPGGQIVGILGSAGTPSYGFAGRSGDGILDDGSGVNISVGGTVQMFVRSGQIFTTTILTVGNVGDANLKRTGSKALQILDDSTASLGFFNSTPVAQQTRGATFTNNITSGGTTDSPANWTDLTTYATDAAAIRNFCYQVARVLVQYDTALRNYGLLT